MEKQELEQILADLKAELAASEFAALSARQELQWSGLDQIESFHPGPTGNRIRFK